MTTNAASSFFNVSPQSLAAASSCLPSPRASLRTAASLEDEALMACFCSGDDNAFAVLFDRYSASIYRHMFRLTHDRTAATDLTQATFLSVVKGRDRFVPGSRFRVWLFVIAINAWRDHRRRGKRELLSADGTLPEDAYEPMMRDLGLEREVRSALALLPEAQREVVVLHWFEDFSFKEIAQMLRLMESAAKVRAHRGYEQLRAILRDAGVDHE